MSRSFLDGFSDHVAERPQATALVWHGERISYSELYERAARVCSAARHASSSIAAGCYRRRKVAHRDRLDAGLPDGRTLLCPALRPASRSDTPNAVGERSL